MIEKSIGLIELSSVAAGFEVADTMLKSGNVRLLLSRSICSGKYMVLVGGDPSSVESAVLAGAASLALGLFSLTLPHTPPRKAGDGAESLAWLEAMKLLKHPFVLVLWLVTLVDSFVHNAYFNWTGVFLGTPREAGVSNEVLKGFAATVPDDHPDVRRALLEGGKHTGFERARCAAGRPLASSFWAWLAGRSNSHCFAYSGSTGSRATWVMPLCDCTGVPGALTCTRAGPLG